MRKSGNTHSSLVEKHVRKGPFRKPYCRLEDKCETCFKKHVLKIWSGLNWLIIDVMFGLL
jgi:hypothetical protein